MKTSMKALSLVLCAILLVTASVLGTLAYLTSTAEVTNTFTVGNVNITLDEAKVDLNGKPNEAATREMANTYKLMPGHTYTKDPIVHFAAGSEASYLFVKVENEIAAIEAATVAGGYQNITAQILANGWTALKDADGNVIAYWQLANANTTTAAVDYKVFEEFKIKDEVKDTDLAAYADAEIVVTAYAIQADGFADADAAWAAYEAQA